MITRANIRRQLRASGGITNAVPREKFGIGSSLKKFVRKVIPNEISEIAVKAAPFVAPFNPALAAAMAGIGGFDQTGRIGSSLKSAATNYAIGQAGRYLGGGKSNLQGNPFSMTGGTAGGPGAFRGGLEGLSSGFSSPVTSGTKAKLFGSKQADRIDGAKGIFEKLGLTKGAGQMSLTGLGKVGAASLASYFVSKGATPSEAKDLTSDVYRGEGMGFEQIKKDMLSYRKGDLSETDLANKDYRFITKKNFTQPLATGGRVGLQAGTPEEGIKSLEAGASSIKVKGDVRPPEMKMAEIPRDMTMDEAVRNFDLSEPELSKKLKGTKEYLPAVIEFFRNRKLSAMGGIMDMPTGNMRRNKAGIKEIDYRATGGFVPVGIKEKADDVPAMLSKNEFVMTADAVRGAGNGSIKKGAQRMYDLMKQNESKVV